MKTFMRSDADRAGNSLDETVRARKLTIGDYSVRAEPKHCRAVFKPFVFYTLIRNKSIFLFLKAFLITYSAVDLTRAWNIYLVFCNSICEKFLPMIKFSMYRIVSNTKLTH